MKRVARPVLVGTVLVCGLSACATRTEFAAFATLGNQYAGMLPTVADNACRSWIDASSWKLIDSATLGRVRPDGLTAADAADTAYCDTTDLLARHADVLGRYFGRLRALASANASGEAGAAMDGLARALQEVGEALRLSAGVTVSPVDMASVVNLVVNETIEARLRRELTERKNLLAREFATLDLVLASLAAEVEKGQGRIRDLRYEVQVVDPLTRGRVVDPEALVEARRLALRRAAGAGSLRAAQAAAVELGASFEALLAADPRDARVMARIEALVTRLTALRGALAAVRT